MNILYVHGFRSSGNAGTAERIRRLLPECRVISPDLPTDAHEALALLKRIVKEEKDITVGAFGNRDEVVDCRDVFLRHYDNAVSFDGGHRLDEEAVRKCVVPAILKLLKEKTPGQRVRRNRINQHKQR